MTYLRGNSYERIRGPFRRTRASLVGVALAAFFVTASPTFAQSICNAGNQVVTTRVDITASCTITGSLAIHGGMVKVDFSAAPTAVFRVEGNVGVHGAGILWIEGGTFEIQQDYNRHRELLT